MLRYTVCVASDMHTSNRAELQALERLLCLHGGGFEPFAVRIAVYPLSNQLQVGVVIT
jgi:hypothetical protein